MGCLFKSMPPMLRDGPSALLSMKVLFSFLLEMPVSPCRAGASWQVLDGINRPATFPLVMPWLDPSSECRWRKETEWIAGSSPAMTPGWAGLAIRNGSFLIPEALPTRLPVRASRSFFRQGSVCPAKANARPLIAMTAYGDRLHIVQSRGETILRPQSKNAEPKRRRIGNFSF